MLAICFSWFRVVGPIAGPVFGAEEDNIQYMRLQIALHNVVLPVALYVGFNTRSIACVSGVSRGTLVVVHWKADVWYT